MRRPPAFSVLRGTALLVLGALAVHQLRYLLAFGAESGAALHREGHGYLAQALPVLVALAAAMLVAALLAGALSGAGPRWRAPSIATRAGGYAGALLVVYAAQELVEGALFASGGWVAVPLAVAFGLLVATFERLHQRGVERIAQALEPAGRPAPAPEPPPFHQRPAATPLAATPLAFGLARRPPPLSA